MAPEGFWRRTLDGFTPADWIAWIEALGISTFEGTSGRYFVENMKASRLLQAWTRRLESRGVRFELGRECTDFEPASGGGKPALWFGEERREFDAIGFALGGGSYEPAEDPLRWPEMFRRRGVGFSEFESSNVGYHVGWSEAFLKEAEGLPLKRVVLKSSRGSRAGELVVTQYGLEGTPVYFVGTRGGAKLDLKPDLSFDQVLQRLQAVRENLSPIRRIKKQLKLDSAALALIFHHAPQGVLQKGELAAVARLIKEFPIELLEPRPLAEAISSSGGIRMNELDQHMMLSRLPGVFAAGEMLDWDAPTGGFLIQGCVATGVAMGRGMLGYLSTRS